ncbi:hypothetical protein WR25_01851 [Diploscapter pachys]|uniref:Uncharacterized protein n=1 Tax=Diploscapter pachys TaxID=2018661 RepID=A0A2A2JCT7_9BILA|nr:hypothetical protein WR25_01851 [Diploscapter pachys]
MRLVTGMEEREREWFAFVAILLFEFGGSHSQSEVGRSEWKAEKRSGSGQGGCRSRNRDRGLLPVCEEAPDVEEQFVGELEAGQTRLECNHISWSSCHPFPLSLSLSLFLFLTSATMRLS